MHRDKKEREKEIDGGKGREKERGTKFFHTFFKKFWKRIYFIVR